MKQRYPSPVKVYDANGVATVYAGAPGGAVMWTGSRWECAATRGKRASAIEVA